MWSNISAPKSGLKAAQVGHQLQPKRENGNELSDARVGGGPRTTAATSNGSPLMRYKHAVCSNTSSGLIYIHGGRFGNGVPLDDDVWRFDPHENSWQQLRTSGAKPPSLQEHSLVEHRGQLYLFGGQVSAASGQENSFWRLDLAKGEWFSLSPESSGSMKFGAHLRPANRRGHSACVHRDSMYIFGGYEDFRGSTNQLWQYDLLNLRWELRNLSSSSACHPEPRHSHSAVVHQDSMYVFGGLSNLKPLSDLWRWSWRDKRWFKERTRGKSPGPLHGHSAIQAFGSMFVFGGERQSGRTTRSLWRLNLSNLCWQKIRTKGPRPSPTTWHAAIANPLGALDEANYLIEGEPSDAEPEADQHRHQHRELRLFSESDNCFSSSSSATNGRLGQTSPLETFRPAGSQQRQSQLARANSQRSSSNERATSDNKPSGQLKLASQTRDRTKTKRRLKLSFLRRNKKAAATVQIPTSWSAAHIPSGAIVGPAPSPNKRHSVEMTGEVLKVETTDERVGDTGLDARNNTVGILDSLDSDIKEMFQRAMSPDEEPPRELRADAAPAPAADDQRTSLARDSLTQSQLSSWWAPGQLSSTQTYQTAREQLTSKSTLTITPALHGGAREPPAPVSLATTRLADVRQRRSMQHFAQTRNSQTGAGPAGPGCARSRRPKSEIVQSLIDQMDAHIKDIYTPHFNQAHNRPHQQPEPAPKFNSNDPILGDLANHRMFERSHEASASKRPALDKSKRHTIHQTMTHYNLCFDQDQRLLESPLDEQQRQHRNASELRGQPMSGDLTQSSDASSDRAGGNALSTSAALVGVRDGAHTANTSSGDGISQRTGAAQLESEVGSLGMASSESRTLCDANGSGQEMQYEPEMSEDTVEGQHEQQQQQQLSRLSDASSGLANANNNDNTSLSFSVIAEFEEDDMLQYSSPTEPKILAEGRDRSDYFEDEDDGDQLMDEPYGTASDEYARTRQQQNGQQANESAISRPPQEAEPPPPPEAKLLLAQKSSSSGYDSIRSSCNNGSSVKREELDARQVAAHEFSTSSSLQTTASNSSAGQAGGVGSTSKGGERQQAFASAATADSLLATSAGESPLTPPSKSLPASPLEGGGGGRSHRGPASSFASSLMAGPSRLFGKKKTKTRYWQLCMFVLGGKQQSGGHGNLNEPISIWRLYI